MASSKKILNVEELEGDSPLAGAESEAPRREPKAEAATASSSSEVREIIVRQGSGWQTTALFFLSLLLLSTLAVAFFARNPGTPVGGRVVLMAISGAPSIDTLICVPSKPITTA